LLTHFDTRYSLLIAGYRGNDVGAAHPLLAVLHAIRNSAKPVTAIKLAPLLLKDLNALVADLARGGDVMRATYGGGSREDGGARRRKRLGQLKQPAPVVSFRRSTRNAIVARRPV
jgi:hypothetical protein